ncbi:MAG: hypothetical protein IKZ98_00800 [Clostridia bacterium]|nr:hypothetical protein [Clostridia bacterium]
MKTCIISFSSRTDGNCAQIGKLIRSMSEEAVLFQFSNFEVHACGKCGYECFEDRSKCPYYSDMEYRLLDAVTRSDLTYFILPNYCDYPCANYFIFNERSQCYFQHHPELLEAYEKVPKRAVVVSNTNEDNFKNVLAYQSGNEMDILFLHAKKYGKVSIRGDLMTDENAVRDVTAFVHKPL